MGLTLLNRGILYTAISVMLTNCQSNTITFKPKKIGEPIDAAVMNFGDMSAEPKPSGKLPQSFPAKQLSGKVVRLSQKGQQHQFWFFPELGGTDSVALVQMEMRLNGEKDGNPSDKIGEAKAVFAKHKNLISRLIMKSYQAMTEKDYKTAIELADQASKIDPELAAPLVLKGLSHMASGEKEGAVSALTQAASLDPDDQSITELLKAAQ